MIGFTATEGDMTTIASLSVSLDGFYTGADPGPHQPMGEGGGALHGWFGHRGTDRAQLTADEVLRHELERTGAMVMGRDSYEHAQAAWGPRPPFRMPLYVVTSRSRRDEVREGSTFHFVGSFDEAWALARYAADDLAVGLHGGGAIRQGLLGGYLDELQLHLVPVLLGRGRRLFDATAAASVRFEVMRVEEGSGVTHVKYRVQLGEGHGAGAARRIRQ